MKSLCSRDIRSTKLPPAAPLLIMPTCSFVPYKIAHNVRQNVLKVVSRHTLSMTSSVEPWNTNRHRMRQELTRALRHWQSRCQEAVFLLMRGCALGTPANKDTRIKVEYVHVEKESDDGAISIRDRTPLRSKKNNLHLTSHRSRHSQRTGEDTMPKHAHLVMVPLSKWRNSSRAARRIS